MIELAGRVRPRIQEVTIPRLRLLADEIGATTALTFRDGEEAVVAAVIEPRNSDAHIAYRVGLRHRLDQAASGMAILAGGAPVADERSEIREAQTRGFALSAGELLTGASGVAAPIREGRQDAESSISAVWVGPRDETSIGHKLVALAELISRELQG